VADAKREPLFCGFRIQELFGEGPVPVHEFRSDDFSSKQQGIKESLSRTLQVLSVQEPHPEHSPLQQTLQAAGN